MKTGFFFRKDFRFAFVYLTFIYGYDLTKFSGLASFAVPILHSRERNVFVDIFIFPLNRCQA